MVTPEKENDMIVEEPREDDVLLGQGHYRHLGNQKLNKIVDAKVDEYKNQSRVFKTYMAHDIINRMRSKGVRFLKELAPKGWVVVKDDKEAREKVRNACGFSILITKDWSNTRAGCATISICHAQGRSCQKSSKTCACEDKPQRKAAELVNAVPPTEFDLEWNHS